MDIHIPGRTRLEHTGIMIQLVGVIVDFANGGELHEFLQEEKQLEKAGTLMGRKVYTSPSLIVFVLSLVFQVFLQKDLEEV